MLRSMSEPAGQRWQILLLMSAVALSIAVATRLPADRPFVATIVVIAVVVVGVRAGGELVVRAVRARRDRRLDRA
jgi:hypothetical protein